MNKKQRKNFIITNIIITVFVVVVLFLESYFMRNFDWWILAISLFGTLVIYGILTSLNMVCHLKKK